MLKSRVGAALAVVLIVAATLFPVSVPVSTEPTSGPILCILCGERGLADFILNIGLYAPLGAALAALGWRWTPAIVAAGLLSLGIEALQIFVIAGRDASIGDLVSNALGAGIGWALRCAWSRRRTLGAVATAVLPVLVALTVVASLMVGLWLLGPSLPDARYYLQWAADLGHMEVFRGEVMASRVGPLGLPGPPGPIQRTDSVRVLLRGGAPVAATFRAGPAPPDLAPIFSIYDERQQEIMLLGADRADGVYRWRSRAEELRLDRAEVRFSDLLSGVGPGDTVTLTVSPRGGVAAGAQGWCAQVGDIESCRPGLAADQTWTLLFYGPGWRTGLRRFLGMVWLMGAFFPAGLLGGRWRDRGVAAVVAVFGITALPMLLGFSSTPLPAVLAAVAGIALGGAVSPLTPDDPAASVSI